MSIKPTILSIKLGDFTRLSCIFMNRYSYSGFFSTSFMKPDLHSRPASVLNRSVKLDLTRSLHVFHLIKSLQELYDQVTSFCECKLFFDKGQHIPELNDGSNLRPRHFLAPPPNGIHSHPIFRPSHLSGRNSSVSSPQISFLCCIA